MRAADRGKQQRIRLGRDDAMEAWVNGHGRKLTSNVICGGIRDRVLVVAEIQGVIAPAPKDVAHEIAA